VLRLEALRAKIDRKSAISLHRGQSDPKFQVEGVAPPIIFARIVRPVNTLQLCRRSLLFYVKHSLRWRPKFSCSLFFCFLLYCVVKIVNHNPAVFSINVNDASLSSKHWLVYCIWIDDIQWARPVSFSWFDGPDQLPVS